MQKSMVVDAKHKVEHLINQLKAALAHLHETEASAHNAAKAAHVAQANAASAAAAASHSDHGSHYWN